MADPYFSNVELLCHFNGTDGATSSTDSGPDARALTFNGNAQLDTAQSKFGGASLLLDGTGDYVSLADDDAWTFGTGQFTVECWVRRANTDTTEAIMGQWGTSGTDNGWFLWWNGGSIQFRGVYGSGATADVGAAHSPATNTWYHIAADRDASNTLRVYVDGVVKATGSSYTHDLRNAGSLLRIGSISPGYSSYDLAGHIDDVRITKGVARYAGAFTPPSAEFEHGESVVTGSLAATESGADTASLTGVVRIAGTISAAEGASDSAALAGVVAVTGTVAAQESGSDTAALTGSASGAITGSLAASESGADSAAAAGVVLIDGALSVVETGADTASASGAVRVAGSIAATESGSDAAALTGVTLVHGALAVAESGSDTASASGAVKVAGALSATEADEDTASLAGIAVQAGTLAAVESGADSASATGAVLVRGSLAVTESGADAAAVVGKTLIHGALAATDAGADIASIAGGTLVQGAFAATEAGSDTAAFSGDATNEWTGVLAAQETGADSASASGVVYVRGSAAITETSADSAIVVGKAFVSGLFAASEAGQDSAAVTGLLVAPTIAHLVARLRVRPAMSARLDSHAAIDGCPNSAPALTARHRLN